MACPWSTLERCILKRLIEVISIWIATGGGIGFIQPMPGTFGTLVAIPIYWVLCTFFSPLFQVSFVIGIIALGIWTAHQTERLLQEKDSQKIVIDEIAGFLVATLLIPFDPFTLVAGFLLFRIFDIAKVPPGNLAERHLGGGVGIMADDLIAGLLTQGVLRLLLALHIAF